MDALVEQVRLKRGAREIDRDRKDISSMRASSPFERMDESAIIKSQIYLESVGQLSTRDCVCRLWYNYTLPCRMTWFCWSRDYNYQLTALSVEWTNCNQKSGAPSSRANSKLTLWLCTIGIPFTNFTIVCCDFFHTSWSISECSFTPGHVSVRFVPAVTKVIFTGIFSSSAKRVRRVSTLI